ncbi:MAG: hypothetical protein ACYTX0_36815 [Nostoc sp.]
MDTSGARSAIATTTRTVRHAWRPNLTFSHRNVTITAPWVSPKTANVKALY